MAKDTKPKTEATCDLLLRVLKRQPDMYRAALVALAAQDQVEYPITCHKDFLRIASNGTEKIVSDEMEITYDQAIKYFPVTFFPIEDEDELIRKTIIASAIGREMHKEESKIIPICHSDNNTREAM